MGVFSNLSNGKKWGLGCGAFVLLMCCGGGAAVLQVVDFPIVANRADAVVRDYKAAGLPWEQGDLKTTLPDEENGAAEFLAAVGPNGKNFGTVIKDAGDAIRDQDWKKAKVAVASKSEITAALRRVSLKKGFDFDRDWDQAARLLLPEYAQMKNAVKLLCFEAQVNARDGNLDLALANVRAAYQIGNMSAKEPTLISMLVGIACQAIALDGALRVAAARKSDAIWVARVRKELDGWKCDIDFKRAMEGVAYMGLATIRNLKGNPLKTIKELSDMSGSGDDFLNDDAHLVRTGLPKGMIATAFAVRNMEVHIRFRQMLEQAQGDYVPVGKDMDEYAEKLSDPPLKSSQLLNTILLPVFSQASVAANLAPFKLEASRGVLRAQEYRLKKGVFPSGFDDLGFEVIDPVLKSRAWYKVVGEEVSIYSVGNNGVDDGGDKQKTKSGDDVTMRFPPRVSN
ncbi:MAG: hypothetical protein ACKVQS_03525 [Fimbriimonadaceae bacterium]